MEGESAWLLGLLVSAVAGAITGAAIVYGPAYQHGQRDARRGRVAPLDTATGSVPRGMPVREDPYRGLRVRRVDLDGRR